MQPATILHLSDLHFGHPNRYGEEPYTTLKDKLLHDLEFLKKSENIAPNIFVVTGDIADKSSEKEYEQAYSFLKEVADELNIEQKSTLLVPGNHDINWGLCKMYFCRQEAEESEPKQPYFPKFEFYQKFFNKFYEKANIFFGEELFVGYDLSQFGILAVGLNSCEHESHRNEDHYGYISVKQARKAGQWCEKTDPSRKHVRIALLHHNLLRGSDYDSENLRNFDDIRDIFEELEITVFLHGHRHQRTMQKLDSLKGRRPLYVMAAGAAGLDKKEIDDIPNGYQILTIDNKKACLYLRRYDPIQSDLSGKGVFIPDVDKEDRWKYPFDIGKGQPDQDEKSNCEHEISRGAQGIVWEQYQKLFDVEGYRVAYIYIINDWKEEPIFFFKNQLKVNIIDDKFKLPFEFGISPIFHDAYDGRCCRMVNYDYKPDKLSVTLQETSYFDYLKSGEQLDAPFPNDPIITNREAYGKLIEQKRDNSLWVFTQLTNICGTGVFILTSDDKIITTIRPNTSHVYPNRYSFSASGVMKWGDSPHPFTEISDKCAKELNYNINLKRLQLIGFGADARKLYFQFSFFESSNYSSDEILKQSGGNKNHKCIPFVLDEIVNRLVEECWEPAAEVALLTICVKKFNREDVLRSLFSHRSRWERREMRDEWDYRASRPGDLPDMSLRYESDRLSDESKEYVKAVIDFMGEKIEGKDVVEIGSGTGRITQHLLEIAKNVTCVEFCEKMIQRSKERLCDKFDINRYVVTFAQCYYPKHRYEVVVCSLVLVHNVNNADFRELIKRLCDMAETVFVFEDVSTKRSTSPRTYIRTIEDIRKTFNEFNFTLIRMNEPLYNLFSDQIAFLEFRTVFDKKAKPKKG